MKVAYCEECNLTLPVDPAPKIYKVFKAYFYGCCGYTVTSEVFDDEDIPFTF